MRRSADFYSSKGTNLGACTPLINCSLNVSSACVGER